MSLYHEAPCGHAVEIGSKCVECRALEALSLQRDLVEALEYYANPAHYEPTQRLRGVDGPGVLVERGELARVALRKLRRLLSVEEEKKFYDKT